jgi:protein-S-isoprenylcysteine O-methyltransferase Ste14
MALTGLRAIPWRWAVWLAGWALLANSLSALFGGVGIFALLVLSWDKWIEEKELSLKHGTAYEHYRLQTPFLLPRFRKQRR